MINKNVFIISKDLLLLKVVQSKVFLVITMNTFGWEIFTCLLCTKFIVSEVLLCCSLATIGPVILKRLCLICSGWDSNVPVCIHSF